MAGGGVVQVCLLKAWKEDCPTGVHGTVLREDSEGIDVSLNLVGDQTKLYKSRYREREP